MGKPKLYTLFRASYSNEVPTITENGTDIDVSKYQKINVNVPQAESESSIKVSLDEFVGLVTNGTYQNDKLYKVVIDSWK